MPFTAALFVLVANVLELMGLTLNLFGFPKLLCVCPRPLVMRPTSSCCFCCCYRRRDAQPLVRAVRPLVVRLEEATGDNLAHSASMHLTMSPTCVIYLGVLAQG
jgi:hypothetical protein